jgi:putative transposase
MAKKQRVPTAEFKQEAVRLMETSGKSITQIARDLGVSDSALHSWRKSISMHGSQAFPRKSHCAKANEQLLQEIEQIFYEHRSVYESPRIYVALRDKGMHCGRKRVACLMRLHGISARRRRSRVETTNSQHQFPIAPHLLQRDFTADAPDTVWVSDFTSISTREGWLYLATVLDVYLCRVIGWSMSHKRTDELVMAALQMAVTWRKPAPGLIHHSERRSQYASVCYQSRLQQHGIVASMSRKGDCDDTAHRRLPYPVLSNLPEQRDVQGSNPDPPCGNRASLPQTNQSLSLALDGLCSSCYHHPEKSDESNT